ncbi:hypothetical protein AAMO2058_001113000 [Amorphochlora amoebiformis]
MADPAADSKGSEAVVASKKSASAKTKATSKVDAALSVFQGIILLLICILAFSTRLFSVLRYESVIHEFDPYFNFRSTKYLVSEGFYDFHNWFDDRSWWPLGRYIGGTVYPGLMFTAAIGYHLLHAFRFTVEIRNVCVMLAPFMSMMTAIATFFLTTELWDSSAGLYAAAFISIVPGYISRSVAGSYDNEACAIFAMILTFAVWVRAVKRGTIFWGAAAAFAYFYMVLSWGGYIFLINLIPLHALALIICGRYSHKLYVAYCTFYILGTILSMHVQFVSFQPVSPKSPEHMGAAAVFGLLQIYTYFNWTKSMVSEREFKYILRMAILGAVGLIIMIVLAAISGRVPFLTARFKALLGSTSNIAIVKSVSEHQPSSWTTFFFDMQCLVSLVPVGLYYCFMHLTDANIFIILYTVTAMYFSSIMVRLVLVLAPVVCVMAGIGASETMKNYSNVSWKSLGFEFSTASADESEGMNVDQEEDVQLTEPEEKPQPKPSTTRKRKGKKNKREMEDVKKKAAPKKTRDILAKIKKSASGNNKIVRSRKKPVTPLTGVMVTVAFLTLFYFYTIHCTWVTSIAYSSPSIVLAAVNHDGSKTVFDDFREAYQWLKFNTHPDARVMSWWDYGYQITAMGNRTVIVDNNTRNNTHIARVGYAMASPEERSIKVIRELDVDYLLVVFGGKIGYSSDDINKFLWMVRISGGIFPEVVEAEYYNAQGMYTVDSSATSTMHNSLMYSMCYYRFGELMTQYGRASGFDRTRNTEIGKKDISFKYLEEAFTSEHWMVRIYRVKKDPILEEYIPAV